MTSKKGLDVKPTPRNSARGALGAIFNCGSYLFRMPGFLPLHFRFSLLVMGVNLALFLLFRMVFLAAFGGMVSPLEEGHLAQSLWLGVKFDVRLAIFQATPMLLLGGLPGMGIARSAFGRVFWLGYLLLVGAGALLFYLIDFGHFAYHNTRINSTALIYLRNPFIAAEAAWETYPVVWAGLGFLLFMAAFGWLMWRLFPRIPQEGDLRTRRWRKILATTGCLAVLLFSVYGKLAMAPLEWKDALYTQQPFLIALGLNPVLYFFSTLEKGGEKYDKEMVRSHYDVMAGYLKVDKPDREKLVFSRWRHPKPKVPGSPNVVLIFMESFAAFKVGAFGNPLNPSPHFDRLAAQGWLFKNFFVPGGGTARSIFSALFGIPDVTRGVAFSINPLSVDHQTIVDELAGYEKLYFIGGDANWRNIRGLVHQNIKGARIYEAGDYKDKPIIDAWGISDTDLFEETNRILARETRKPFFAVIQTASDHAPYTIPADSKGFISSESGLKIPSSSGFNSTREFDSSRFIDHALGYFMGLARKEDYFDNTLFVIFGDHGRPGSPSHFPPGLVRHRLIHQMVPLLIFGPKLLGKPREIMEVASELDVMPTLAGLLGIPYWNHSLGRDLLEEGAKDPRFAFLMDHNQVPPRLGLLDKEFFLLVDSDGRSKMFRYLSTDWAHDVRSELPERAAVMEGYLWGFYETSRYLLFKGRGATTGP